MAAGVYIHIPFCRSRCSYCDFATDIYRDPEVVERYADALCTEISSHPKDSDTVVDTIYFGGGTPSLLTPEQIGRILASVNLKFEISGAPEITLEMNPATVTPQTLTAYHKLGVNRASFGVQTFNERHLKLLARGHDANDARETFRMLREAEFDNISFDLIAGLPGQTLKDWRRNLDEAVAMEPEHISLYLLEIHEGTPLAEQVRSGRRPTPDEDLAAEMYEVMLDRLAETGYEQYEISNFSKPGLESRHNIKYWRMEPVYGFGVSAHSFDGSERYANTRRTDEYIKLIKSGSSAEVMRERVDVASETAFLGLRLEPGINLTEYQRSFGADILSAYGDRLNELIDAGLLESSNDDLRLTRKGKLLSNEVFAVFV